MQKWKRDIAEQFTFQELLAYQDFHKDPSLFYWAREARNSNAEIDYVIPYIPFKLKLTGNQSVNILFI